MLIPCFVVVFVEDLFMFSRVGSKKSKTSNAVGMSSLIFWLQAQELWLSVCFNSFRNLSRSYNKRRISPAQTITSEWTAEIRLEKRVQSKRILKRELVNRTKRWWKYKCMMKYWKIYNSQPPNRIVSLSEFSFFIQTIAAQVTECNGNNARSREN